MAEPHPAEDVLLDIALGNASDARADEYLVDHLEACAECRSRYDAITRTIDYTLPSTQRIQPRLGFDQAVLESMGLAGAGQDSLAGAHRRRFWRRRPVMLAAACVLGVVVGVGGAIGAGVLEDEPPPAPEVVAAGTPLMTGEGQTVGAASFSQLGDQRVLVVSAAGGTEGATYECRLQLADGDTTTVGEWPVPAGGATWVVPAPQTPVVSVELVTNDGTVWSVAKLPPPSDRERTTY